MQGGPDRVAKGSDGSEGGVGLGKPLGAPKARRGLWSETHLCVHELRGSKLWLRTPLDVGMG